MAIDYKFHRGAVVGIIGGGQLGLMLAMAASKLGFKAKIFTPDPESPAARATNQPTIAAYDDSSALKEFATSVDLITYEFENIPVTPLAAIKELCPVLPDIKVLATTQDRLAEKRFLSANNINIAPYAEVKNNTDLHKAITGFDFNCIVKQRRFGYDGKGQTVISKADDITKLTGVEPETVVVEQHIAFDKEISIIACRNRNGDVALYEPAWNTHINNTLAHSIVPAPIDKATAELAAGYALDIINNLEYVGVMGVEMFVIDNNQIMINELAPRVHNSGHWTLDACICNQFEQHIRAITGMEPGTTIRHSDVKMVNLLGDDIINHQLITNYNQASRQTSIYDYGKTAIKPGRKMGHVNILT